MSTIDDLEAQLRDGLDRGVDRDIVTVYGDQLQALEDPRGELIAIDLEIESSGGTPLLARRRAELIEGWLGSERPNGAIRYGFLELDATSADPVTQIRLGFGSRAARFTRSVTAVGPPKMLRDTLDAIAEAPRPFLSRVTLRLWSDKELVLPSTTRFARATPHLQGLELDARLLLGPLAHPTLRRLRISGFDALPLHEVELPSLVELDLAFHCHLATSRLAPSPALFDGIGDGMPNLTALDLSRNEPGYLDPHNLGGDTPLFALLARLGCRGRLEKLTLPAPTTPAATSSLRAALREMPALRELAIARIAPAAGPALVATLARDDLVITVPQSSGSGSRSENES